MKTEKLTCIKPTGSWTSITMDYASLYPTLMRYPSKQNIRKIKIKKLFSL